jgi:1,4-alpha-glucan branching enzyme
MIKKKFLKTKDECEVTFEYSAPAANTVTLVTDANDWKPVAMKKGRANDAPFQAKMRLPKDGQFQFRYLVDNEIWANDEAADAYWANEHGGDNSVVFTAQN